MPYRLSDGEAADEAIRRTAAEQLDRAINELTDGVPNDPVEAVHAARKALKKERSLLRLARGSMKSATRRRENAALREAGRRLSAARDAEVVVQSLGDLAQRYAGQVPEKTFEELRTLLSATGQGQRESVTGSGLAGEVAEELRAARRRTGEWRLRRQGWKAVEEGLRRSYRRGRRAYKRARAEPTVEHLHEWRKRAKDYWYHLRLLEPVAPRTMKGHAKDAHRLSDLLGDDHDLALLRESLRDARATVAADVDAVIRLLDHRRGQLQEQAMFLGRRLYAEKPRAFVRRVHTYWKAWRAEVRASQAQQPAQLAELTRKSAGT
jgi:CHAD domain-containing protein